MKHLLRDQLPLFAAADLPPARDRDPSGFTNSENAKWIIDKSPGFRLVKEEKTLLFATAYCNKRPTPEERKTLSALHRRIGGRPLSSFLPWERT